MKTHGGMERERTSDLRVVLVGRTGLEDSLSGDPKVEVRCAHDGLCAVGEAAEPVDDDSPMETAVVVASDAVRRQDWSDFVEAVRSVRPEARVLRISDNERSESDSDRQWSCDGVLGVEADAATVRALVEDARRRAEVEFEMTDQPEPTDRCEPNWRNAPFGQEPAPSPASFDATSELPALDAMLAGRDPLEACLTAIRSRLGADDVRFAPADVASVKEANEIEASVHRRGRTFGALRSASVSAEALRAEADWLARWLALSEQVLQLREAAFTDPLTGAWNRRYFEYFLSSAIEQARERRHDVTLMIYDIDNFKEYNDRFGHAAGDEILRETVRLLHSVIRPTDRVCRIGGDEFAVIFDDPRGPRDPRSHHPMSIQDIASRFQRQICEHRFPKLGAEAPSTLTISGGLATFPWDGQCPESLRTKADELAMESKRQGKNVLTFGPGAERVCQIRFGGDDDADRPDADES